MGDYEQLWTAVSQLLRAQVSEAVWFSTFQDVVALESGPDEIRVSAPNTHLRDRIMSRYLPLVRDALDDIGASNRTFVVDVQVDEQFIEPPPEPSRDDSSHSSMGSYEPSGAVAPRTGGASTNTNDPAGLNPRYSFDAFVKGQSNQFALAAAQRVAETPGRSYNPLFIYGQAGLGKTHLLHAIGHYVHRHYQHDVVRYVSTETFLNEYVDAIRSNTTANFKRRYRDIDVLLIDDIQFMEGKEGLQEEFFHTFNSLHGANKQIVISSDRMPDAIPTLEERLRGRFKWGLITDVQPPDMETRLAILRNKAERDDSRVPAETLEFIATHITSNIRELEGALIRVTAYASLNRVPITTHLAETLLKDLLTDRAAKGAHRRRVAQRDGHHPRPQRRRVVRQEPSATAGHQPSDRHVCVPRPHRPVVPGHCPSLRWSGSHHGDSRSREDPTADERAQAGVRPGHRDGSEPQAGIGTHVTPSVHNPANNM